MSNVLAEMTKVAFRAQYGAEFDPLKDGVREQFMKAALLYLADNVTEEMARAAYTRLREVEHLNNLHQCIAAAIRKAAEDHQ